MEQFGFARIFQDGILLQRDAEVKIWGKGAKGPVTVKLIGKLRREAFCEGDKDGYFCAKFDAFPGGEDIYRLYAECASGTAEVLNVRFGDVLLLAGQSNLSYCLSAVEGREEFKERARRCRIVGLHLEEDAIELSAITRPAVPQNEIKKEYEYVAQDSERILSCSAIGVMSAVLLYERTGIPVGFVDTSMGGLSVESYLPRAIVESESEIKDFLIRSGRYVAEEKYNQSGERNFTQLSGVYNEKIAPLYGLKFRAIVWYLGESSAFDYEHARYFKKELRLIVEHYRGLFGNIPFLAIQIAPEYYPYGDRYGYLYVNESIGELQGELNDYYAIPTYCIEPRWLMEDGDMYYHPIHTVNKKPVAEAVAHVLCDKTKFPSVVSFWIEGGCIYCRIADAGEGLDSRREMCGFTISGEDGKYFPADAQLVDKDVIRLSSPHVKKPCDMTYAFSQEQSACNLRLKSGEALLPYRSEKGSVHKGYYFFPPYWDVRKRYVRENCFGYNVGTCRIYPSWVGGKIYGASCRITHSRNGLKVRAVPKNRDYFFFGISPNICLSGQSNHLADYGYLLLEMTADTAGVQFFGIAVRRSGGEVFRFAPLNGGEMADYVPVAEEKRKYCVELKRVFGEDMSVLPSLAQEREEYVEAEFLFRSKNPCSVEVCKIEFADEPLPVNYGTAESGEKRFDTQLPEN